MEGSTPKEEKPIISVSQTTPEDIEGLQNVHFRTWLATYPNAEHGVTEDDIKAKFEEWHTPEDTVRRKQTVAAPKSGEMHLVAKDAGKVIGFCRARRGDQENELVALYVLPEYQGQGVGSALWSRAAETLDLTKDTVLYAAEYNKNAIAFYEHLGFKDTGERTTDETLRMKSGSIIPEIKMVLKGTR